MTHRIPLERLNAMPATEFAAALGDVFEHAAWVAEQAASGRPYPTLTLTPHTGLAPRSSLPPRACVLPLHVLAFRRMRP